MSIVIKGMEMPKRCFDCDLYDDENQFCKAQKEFMPMAVLGNYKDKDCPIVALPEEHGDLIDRTALLKEFELAQKSADMHGREYANAFYSSCGEISAEWWTVEELAENAIAVIEAEDGK